MQLLRLNQFNRKEYLHHKRLAIIQKSKLPLQIRLQRVMNNAIDRKILDDYDDDYHPSTTPPYKEEILTSQIGQLNKIATQQDFERLMQRSIVNQNHITKLEQYNASHKISDRITKIEVERINKNLEYIEKTLESADIDIQVYKELVEKLPKQISRKDMLEKALTSGKNYMGREYSFKELSQLSRDLEKYKLHHIEYEKGLIENRQADREGLPAPNTTKTWIWSQLERTRHQEMDGETVRFGEKFEVVNEVTGDIDMLRFPGDIENDTHNCSNICNCGCSYEIN